MSPIRLVDSGLPVSDLVGRIESHPNVWNRYGVRRYGPHSGLSDIWCRYNAYENFLGDRETFNDEHESVWYPEAEVIGVKPLVFEVMHRVRGERLGGVLITKIPAGSQCLPHVDRGWHATYYEKFAVQLRGNEKQAFHFEKASLVTRPGDLFWFDNSFTHWVTNDSDEDRMTLIICIRRSY